MFPIKSIYCEVHDLKKDLKFNLHKQKSLVILLCSHFLSETLKLINNKSWLNRIGFLLRVAMPVQYELRRLFHLMNIQTHRYSTQKALFLCAYFNS